MIEEARPRPLEFDRIGSPRLGYLAVQSFAEGLPFVVKRVFWTFGTPANVTRGRHAHHATEMVLVAVNGSIEVSTELANGFSSKFVLDSPSRGLYIPPRCWRTMSYSPGAVQLAFASTEYSADDYIRDYDDFRSNGKP